MHTLVIELGVQTRTLWGEQGTEGLWSPFIHKLVDLLGCMGE